MRDFLQFCFEAVDLDWEKYVHFDERYLRPTEVDALIGDPSRATEQLGWTPKVLTPRAGQDHDCGPSSDRRATARVAAMTVTKDQRHRATTSSSVGPRQPERANEIPVSVIIMTKNEARVIARTVDSVRDFAEVFVVDSNSDDDTQAIAKAHGATVVPFTWNGQYPEEEAVVPRRSSPSPRTGCSTSTRTKS